MRGWTSAVPGSRWTTRTSHRSTDGCERSACTRASSNRSKTPRRPRLRREAIATAFDLGAPWACGPPGQFAELDRGIEAVDSLRFSQLEWHQDGMKPSAGRSAVPCVLAVCVSLASWSRSSIRGWDQDASHGTPAFARTKGDRLAQGRFRRVDPRLARSESPRESVECARWLVDRAPGAPRTGRAGARHVRRTGQVKRGGLTVAMSVSRPPVAYLVSEA